MSEHAPLPFWRRYIFSTDHKVIGLQYILTAAVMAVVAVTLSVLIRFQMTWPGTQYPIMGTLLPGAYEGGVLKPESYLSLVTMHGTIMVFFVISIGLVSGMGNFIIPLQIGARDMAYPFLNALSYWTIVPACLIMIGSFLVEGGAAAGGWTSYPPLSALPEALPGSGMGQTLWLLGMALFIASFTMGGLNFLVTILNLRTKGMSMMRMPLTIWTYLVSATLGILAFPPLTAAAIMLLLDRHGGTSFFLPSGLVVGGNVLAHEGGTPLLFQHLFWFLGHPEVYVLLIPALGIAFDVVATFGRRPVFGYRTTVWSLLIVAVLSMIVWGHHMFTSGMNPYVGEYFSVMTVMITLPFSVVGLNLVASLWRAELRLRTPMLFALGIISAVGTGGLGGLYLGTAASDIYFHDSVFVVGHFHFMIGVVTSYGIFAGLYYWFPKMFGRYMNETLGKAHFWMTTAPVFFAFIMMHYLGLAGALRRVYDPSVYEYIRPLLRMNVWITYALLIAITAQVVFFVNLVYSMFRGPRASENPWEGATLEWTTASPAPHLNWDDPPTVYRGPYEYRTNEAATGYTPQHVPGSSPGAIPPAGGSGSPPDEPADLRYEPSMTGGAS
jgi:cytochrome c oxidase subunit 1